MPTLDEIEADFTLLDEWEDRYRYVIELGRAMAPLDPAFKTEATKVRGCASQVWLIARREAHGAPTPGSRNGTGAVSEPEAGKDGPRLHFAGESDALIVQGLIAILLAVYDGRRAREIAATDAHAILKRLGLAEHLTPQRSNGLKSMIERIRSDAATALAEAGAGR